MLWLAGARADPWEASGGRGEVCGDVSDGKQRRTGPELVGDDAREARASPEEGEGKQELTVEP